MKVSKGKKKKLIEAYKAFYQRVISETDTNLSLDQRKAVAQKLLDGFFATAFTKAGIPENEQPTLKRELEELIRQECPELLEDTPLEYTGTKFKLKS